MTSDFFADESGIIRQKPTLKKKWQHKPCLYADSEEDCPVCDEPICDCGNPGWACNCNKLKEE